MSIDRVVCKRVRERWRDLGLAAQPSERLAFMKVQGKLSNNASIIALVMDTDSAGPVAAVKIPRNPTCTIGVDSEHAAMAELRRTHADWSGADRLSSRGFVEDIAGTRVLFQNAAVGHSLVRDMISAESVRSIYARVLPWLLDFHRHGSEDVTLDGDRLERLVAGPVRKFLDDVRNLPGVVVPDRLGGYLQGLAASVAGEKVRLCAQHGDFNAHNIVVRGAAGPAMEFSVIDWEDFRGAQLPVHDLNHFFISNSKLVDMKLNAADAFARYLLSEGWYRDLYMDSVRRYEAAGMLKSDVFLRLTPLYMVEICLRLMGEQRNQESTLGVWIDRAVNFIERFPALQR